MAVRNSSSLEDIVVVDDSSDTGSSSITVAGLICRLLAGAGADVVRLRAVTGPCGIPHADLPAGLKVDRVGALARADVVLTDDGDAMPSDILERAVVVVINDGGVDGHQMPTQVHELVAQTVTGAVFEHIPGRPAFNGMLLGTYGAAINAATAVVAALLDRLSSGLGQRLDVSLTAGVVGFMGTVWSEFVVGDSKHGFAPIGADFPLYRCADGQYVCVTPGPARRHLDVAADAGRPTGLELLREALDLDVDAAALRGTRREDDLSRYYVNSDAIAEGFARVSSADIVKRLRAVDMSVEIVRPPGDAWDLPEVAARGLISKCHCGVEHIGFPIEGL